MVLDKLTDAKVDFVLPAQTETLLNFVTLISSVPTVNRHNPYNPYILTFGGLPP